MRSLLAPHNTPAENKQTAAAEAAARQASQTALRAALDRRAPVLRLDSNYHSPQPAAQGRAVATRI